MRTRQDLHPYQEQGLAHVLDHPFSGLFLEMGLGKTVVTLTALDDLLFNQFTIRKVLVIATLRVAQHTWAKEIEGWQHLRHLRISKILGDVEARVRGLKADAEIYLINRENVAWLVTHLGNGRRWPFDMVVVDELSSFKNPQSKRFKSLRKIRPKLTRLIGLTGTPAPNGLMDLWSQVYLMDRGERLYDKITSFRAVYFDTELLMGSIPKYTIKPGAAEKIHGKLQDICVSMKAKDYLDLPPRLDLDEWVDLGPLMGKYNEFERDLVLQFLQDGQEITAVNAADLFGKLLQFTGGAVYEPGGRTYQKIHDKKLEALEELLEASVGHPVLVGYSYQHERTRILDRIRGSVHLQTEDHIEQWNRGEIPVLVCHPASAGHGLNLQHGGHRLIHYGLSPNLELYLQLVARLDRQGQKYPVLNHRLLVPGTQDVRVLGMLDRKDKEQGGLMAALKALIRKHKP
jgi:SNF2 family DNA or RNA helicase